MRRADRLFDIIQSLRTTARPTTGAALADRLEVTARTINRDIAALPAAYRSKVPLGSATYYAVASICRP
jgi:predicted DNA-binding transcriptional regulator YafY